MDEKRQKLQSEFHKTWEGDEQVRWFYVRYVMAVLIYGSTDNQFDFWSENYNFESQWKFTMFNVPCTLESIL